MKQDSDFQFIRSLIEKYKAIDFSIKRARLFVEEAKSALDELDANQSKDELFHFADFLIDRDF